MKTTKIKMKMTLPKVIKSLNKNKFAESFPLDHYSYSSFVSYSSNPIMFKIKYINRDKIDSLTNISSVIGKAFHSALEGYYNIIKEGICESDAIIDGLNIGSFYIEQYNEGYIQYSKTVETKQKAIEIFTFAFNSYVKEKIINKKEEIISCEQEINTTVDIKWKDKDLKLPIPLKGILDKIIKIDGKLKIVDYKTTRAFSDPDKIDGSKILQAIQYYLLVYAEYGEEPYSIIFEEVKTSKNRNGEKQIKEYEIIYSENELFFDFYFRFYEDVTNAINGQSSFVPNIHSFFDNDVAITSYIYRLDQPEELAKTMNEMKVDNITDLLKKKIENASSMKTLLKTMEKTFIPSVKNINYKTMNSDEKIQTKLMEHGVLVRFEDKIDGNSVELYRFTPSIGLKMNKLKGYASDIEQVLGVSNIRILAPIPNSTMVGFEVPKKERVFLGEADKNTDFNLSIGKDVYGETISFDIRKAPHMLIAGATGSGKSVFLNSIISQLTNTTCELYLFDPKIVELSIFKSQAKEYSCETEDIFCHLDDLVVEMNNRYKTLSDAGARNIEEYSGDMKYKFIIIDEFGDLVLGKGKIAKQIKEKILILAQKARACGIHLIIATQRPSVDIIDGSIKANFPTKVAFKMAKAIDSQILLDEAGAERLLGKGDMLFSSDDGIIRLQGFNS